MHRLNNMVIMQTEQLGRIEALEEELRSSRDKVAELERKMTEQDWVIAQLVGDNLDHLQDNMRLTAHINSSSKRMAQMEHRLGQVGSIVMGFLEGRMEGLEETSELSGDNGVVGQQGIGVIWRRSGRPGFRWNRTGRWSVAGGDEEGQSDVADVRVDRVNGEGCGGGWTWGVVQRESGGRPGELEWVQLQCVGQSGSSGDYSLSSS